jgi:uncharacterized protein
MSDMVSEISNEKLRDILASARVIALVGYSPQRLRVSHEIGKFLQQMGYTVYPVNPTVQEIDGQKSYPSLADVPQPIDIVNVFRRSEFLPGVVDEAIKAQAGFVWAQVGVFSEEAAKKAAETGLPMVMDACIRVGYRRLIGQPK